MAEIDKEVLKAIKVFWGTRRSQIAKQVAAGKSDAGARGAVTGGKQMLGFEELTVKTAKAVGIPEDFIHFGTSLELPGYFRPEKRWDLIIVDHKKHNLIAVIEFKSQVGPSFGNNFNNRAEESIGNAACIWTAYREGAFGNQMRPWLGYLFVLEEEPRSLSPVKINEPHFPVFSEFKNSSYAKRYELLISRLIKERHYDAGCLLLTKRDEVPSARSPNDMLSARSFFSQFEGHLQGYLKAQS